MAQVDLREVSKTYPGGIEAVSAVDLEIDDGELFVVVGPSGSGKSTLLRLIAGLETPTGGSIRIGGRRVDPLPPNERDVAMVFQNPALYPYLSIAENLAFGLRARGERGPEVASRVAAVAALLGLNDVMDRRPGTLSGGQRQRVALGKALVRRPQVFLLDEPLSSLDAPLRASLRAELIDWHRRLEATMIHVTHDQAEALAMGDRIAVMDRGRVVQSGPPLDVYNRPANRFVAEFVGSPPMKVLPCLVGRSDDSFRLQVAGTPPETAWTVPADRDWVAPLARVSSGRIDLGIRPEHVDASETGTEGAGEVDPSGSLLWAAAEVRRLEPLGHETLATLNLGAYSLMLRIPPQSRFRVGVRLPIRIDARRAAWFDAETGAAIDSSSSP